MIFKKKIPENERFKIGKYPGLIVMLSFMALIIILSAVGSKGSVGIIISEIIAKNEGAVCAEDGNFYDCIELCNTSDKAVNLRGMGLTDKDGKAKYVFEKIILEPGDVYLMFCDNNADFSLKASGGETLRLLSSSGRTLYSAETLSMDTNCAMVWDGEKYIVTDEISPGYPNTDEGRADYAASRYTDNPALVISELITDNLSLISGGAQLVELENVSNKTLNLSDFWISDNPVSIFRFNLPDETLEPGQVRVFTFGTEDADAEFRFSKNEYAVLSDCFGMIMSCLTADMNPDCSISYLEDGGYEFTSVVTPGYPNNEDGRRAYLTDHPRDALIISEVLNWNRAYLDVYGVYYDIIEIRNTSSAAVDLSLYSLSDSEDNLLRAPLSGTLNAGDYTVYVCSRDGGTAPYGYTMLPISLSKEGDVLILSQKGTPVQSLYIPETSCNQSYGLASNGEYALLSSVTLGWTNSCPAKKSNAIEASQDGGVYNDVECVTVELNAKGKIYYTLDCTNPTQNSTPYTGPITLEKTGVIRARAYEDGCSGSDIFTATYIINEGHTMEVACLVSDPEGLFDYNWGILEDGPYASDTFPHFGANYWNGWEREAIVCLYANDGTGFQEPCAIRVFGGFSRGMAQKAINVVFRSYLGTGRLHYPLFGEDGLDEFNCFVFRAAGQDSQMAHMRDALTTAMADDLVGNMLIQQYRPVVLYINGQYWGVYYIRENINENFVGGKCNCDPSSVNIIFQWGDEDWTFQEIVVYTWNHDMNSKESWDFICSRVNVESYMNYVICEMWSANYDIGNVRYFRSPQYDNGRWNWMLYDMDWSMQDPGRSSVEVMLTDIEVYSAQLFRGMLANNAFKDRFLTEFARQINEVWNEENVNRYIDDFVSVIGDEMKRHCQRWGWSYDSWKNEVQIMRDYPENRRPIIYDYVKSYFGLSDAQMKAYGFVR